MKKKEAIQLTKIFKNQPVVLAYQHGSAITGQKGRLSDLDFAVLLKSSVKKNKYLDLRLEMMDKLGRLFPKEKIDLAILNEASPLLKSQVIKKGKLLFCNNEAKRVEFMTKTFREYQDFSYLRRTFYHFLEERVKKGTLGERSYDTR